MESRRNAAMTMGASSRTDTSLPSAKQMRVDPTDTCRTWVTASTLIYVDASSALRWSTTHFATPVSLAMGEQSPDTRMTRNHWFAGEDGRLGDACHSVVRASIRAPRMYAVEQTGLWGRRRLAPNECLSSRHRHCVHISAIRSGVRVR